MAAAGADAEEERSRSARDAAPAAALWLAGGSWRDGAGTGKRMGSITSPEKKGKWVRDAGNGE